VLQQDAQAAEAAHLESLREKQRREFEAKWYGQRPGRSGFASSNRGLRR